MKNQAKRFSKALAIALIGLALSSCGKSNKSNTNTNNPYNPYGNGVYNYPGGQIPASGGCAPITGPIPFVAQNVYMDWATIAGGYIPQSGQPYGQVVVGGSGIAGGQYNGSGSDFSISMSVTPANYGAPIPYSGYPNQSMFGMPNMGYNTQYMWGQTGAFPYGYNGMNQGNQFVNIQGMIQLSSLKIQQLVYYAQMGQLPIAGVQQQQPYSPYGYGYNTINPSQICVSAMAFNVGHYYSTVYGGYVYIYLNGTNYGLPLRI